MFVICFIPNKLAGGFGDRIVGLIAVRLLSKALHQPFYILWNRENIRPYIDYSDFDFEKLNFPNDKIMIYSYIDNQSGLKPHLMNTPLNMLFDNEKANCFFLNQEIAQYLYKNAEMTGHNYYNDILAEYKLLYTEILKPAPSIIRKINKLTMLKNNIVGIQLRCGDKYMVTNRGEGHTTGILEQIPAILNRIKTTCDSYFHHETEEPKYHIFLTSDYDKSYDECVRIWGGVDNAKSQIIYNTDIIQHLDRQAVSNDISKVFVDNYILSQNTKMLFISLHSNYGRIAGLSAIHDNVYDLDCNRLTLKNLFSKDENFSM